MAEYADIPNNMKPDVRSDSAVYTDVPAAVGKTPVEQLRDRYPDLEFTVNGVTEPIENALAERRRQRENTERINAAKGPGYADHCDPPGRNVDKALSQNDNGDQEMDERERRRGGRGR